MTVQTTVESEVKTTAQKSQSAWPGAVVLGESLLASGVEMIFGAAGGASRAALSGMIDAGVSHMTARTEASGAWMSYGYNKVLGAGLPTAIGAKLAAPERVAAGAYWP
jgi:acetolactate synthase-1/2/3 large subunit